MRIYIGLLIVGFLAAMISILCRGVPEQPLIWAATATASLVPVLRRYPERGGAVLVAIAVAELVLGLTVRAVSGSH